MALYQLTLFYPNLREFAETVRGIKSVIEDLSGKNWRVLSAGEQVCAIVFSTDEPPSSIDDSLHRFGGKEHFWFLLVEIAAVHNGYMSQGAWQWLKSYRQALKK